MTELDFKSLEICLSTDHIICGWPFASSLGCT
jgi:hypothetical protein